MENKCLHRDKTTKQKTCSFCNTKCTQKTYSDRHLLGIHLLVFIKVGESANDSLLESVAGDDK